MNQKLGQWLGLLVVLLPSFILAQGIGNTASLRQINNSKYARFHYDNNYFTATDYYYTQGYQLEWGTPFFKKNRWPSY